MLLDIANIVVETVIHQPAVRFAFVSNRLNVERFVGRTDKNGDCRCLCDPSLKRFDACEIDSFERLRSKSSAEDSRRRARPSSLRKSFVT